MRYVCCFLSLLGYLSATAPALNIALHAQVAPTPDKVVGSVITTDGLKSAFSARPEVDHVEIFYPLQYSKLFDHAWDLVVIEGWFPAVGDFISMARVNSKRTLVFFYCLDPTYPGMDVVSRLDIDGLLTNSESVRHVLQSSFPSQLVMLAADPLHMAPVANVTRNWGAVYIGAGGGMVHYKYLLLDMLRSALDYGLRLHGSHWDEIPGLNDFWMGPLSRHHIPEAYSSAHTILATTTDDQRTSGMINNRIFEALSCGGVVISERNPAVVATFGDLVHSIEDGAEAGPIIREVLRSADSASVARMRRRGREAIVRQHTWHHRVVSIMDLFYHVREETMSGNDVYSAAVTAGRDRCRSSHRPLLAWIVSTAVERSADYLILRGHLLSLLSEYFCVSIFTQNDWIEAVDNASELRIQFDVLMAHVYIFDALDRMLQQQWSGLFEIKNGTRVQKTMAYVYGPAAVTPIMARAAGYDDFMHYDVVWYRSEVDITDIESAMGVRVPLMRRQHVFGISDEHRPTMEDSLGFTTVVGDVEEPSGVVRAHATEAMQTVVMCSITHREACTADNIKAYSQGRHYMLLLMGGQWSDWVSHGDLFGFDDVDVFDKSSVGQYLDLISRTVHVSEGRRGQVDQYIASAEELVYISSPVSAAADSAWTRNSLWPFVVAMKGYTMIRLTHGDLDTVNYVYRIAAEGVSNWNLKYLTKAVRIGVARLIGLPRQSANSFIMSPVSGSIWFGTKKTLLNSNSNSVSIDFRVSNRNVLLGRDGQSCVYIDGVKKSCLIRPTKQIGLSMSWSDVALTIPLAYDMLVYELSDTFIRTCPNIASISYTYASCFAKIEVLFSTTGTIFSENVHVDTATLYVPLWLKFFCPKVPDNSDCSSFNAADIVGGINGVLQI